MDNAVRLWNAVFDRQRIRLVAAGVTGVSMVTDISLIRDEPAPLRHLAGGWAVRGIDFSYPTLRALQAEGSIITQDPSPACCCSTGSRRWCCFFDGRQTVCREPLPPNHRVWRQLIISPHTTPLACELRCCVQPFGERACDWPMAEFRLPLQSCPRRTK